MIDNTGIIPRELIKEAKEKVGDEAAVIIAELLNVENFDEKRLRGCCPFHDENTPSFIWNSKTYTYKCFGCGKNIDILDAYMATGKTFTEAVSELFELADIKYSFGTHKVKTKEDYKYPKEVKSENIDAVCKYLQTRCISRKTAEYLDIRQDEHQNIVFNYYDLNDTLTMVKYRPSHKIDKSKESKNFCQKGADTLPLLFNMNRINTEKPLLICCGELDCAAAIESGFKNAVSIPFGDHNTHWINENYEWLEQFQEIILCPDNDKAGDEFKKNVLYRLGSWRCKIVEIPKSITYKNKNREVNDLNEFLFFTTPQETLDLINNAKGTPIDSVIDFSDIKDLDMSDIEGVETGFQELDKEIMRLFFGNLNVVTGLPGAGKTSLLYQIFCQALDQDIKCWLFSRELPGHQTKNWMNFILAGRHNLNNFKTNTGAEFWKVTQLATDCINDHYRDRLFIYKDDYDNSSETILQSMTECCRKKGAKLFIIDNLMTVNLHTSDNNKNDKQTDFIMELISFAQKYNVCVILVAHPRKTINGEALTKFDIAGTSNIINLAHRSFSLRRVSEKEKEGVLKLNGDGYKVPPIDFDCILTVLKDRQRGREGFELGLYYDEQCRRFYSNKEEFNYQYKWDQTKYTKELAYPPDEKKKEVFGEITE